MNYNTIIWDWNGTLLNDVDICIDTMNVLLDTRNLKNINQEKYMEVFTFPVKDYYEKIGFDFEKEPFETPAKEFIDIYLEKIKEAKLFIGADKILRYFDALGFKQFVLSAMEQNDLEESVNKFNISEYFIDVIGIDDIFANGKQESASKLVEEYKLKIEKTCIIGDTEHDFEVATNLNLKSIIVTNGHQSHSRLVSLDTFVLKNLGELFKIF